MAKKTAISPAQQETHKPPNDPEQKMPAEPQAGGERTRSARTFRPRVDIYETERGLMLLADMPGATPEGLTITLDRRALNVHAQVQDHAPEGYSPIYQEYQVGDFECDFTLSGDFDADKIEASLTNGVLRLTVPRAAQAEARTIKITGGT
jgi:HSP20 family molecular chaperone IbpA